MIKYLQEPLSTVVSENSPVVLTCPVSPSSAVVRWYYQDKPLNEDYHGITINDTTLSINEFHVGNALTTHEGIYYCVANTPLGSLISQPAWLQVPQFDGFTFKEENITIDVIEGGTASLPCSPVHSVPKALLTFEKLGDSEMYSNYSVMMPSNNFLISNIQIEDAGIYRCVATNPVTNETCMSNQMVTLDVISLESAKNQSPFIFGSKKPTILFVQEGDTIILECAAFAKPPPKITWRKYGGHLLDIRRGDQISGNLVIKNINHRDKGTYICQADNGIGNKVEKVFQIEVLEPPKTDKGHVMVEEGDKAVLGCLINKKSNFTMKWYYNGQRLIKSKNIRIRDTSVVIKSTFPSRAGLYQCMVYNTLGALYAVIELEVQSAGTNGERNNTQTQPHEKEKKSESPVGSTVTKQRQSPVGSTINKQRQIIKKNRNGRRKTRIKSHKRKIKMKKKNSKDKVKNTNMVPPSKPKVTKHSDSSVLVEWTVPANDGMAITFFVVQYKEVVPNKGHWQTEDEQILPKVRKVTVDRLRPGGTYKFRIAAVYSNNDNAVGTNSDHFTLEEDGDHSSEKRLVEGPTIVKVEQLVVDKIYALVVEWKYIRLKSIPISGFIIFYKRYDLNVAFTNITLHQPGVRKHIIRNLEPGKDYRIKMQCFNKAGYSKFSNKVVKHTSPENWEDDTPPIATASPSRHQPATTQMTTMENPGIYESPNSFQSSELLYKILGGILAVMVVVLLVLMVMCCIKQRQQRNQMANMSCYQDPHKKYINGGHYGLNGSITNGHLPHHSYHSQHYQHNSSQSSPKSYTVTDVMDGYTSASAPSKSPPMYPSDIGSDVYEDMYNHLSVGDTNCNSIDQSKSPQIMQVKHSGSNNNHRSANCLKLETLNTTDSLTVLEHMLPSHKSGHLLSSSNGITQICGSYEKVPNAINNSLFHNQHNSMEMVPNTSEHSQPCDNFLVMDSSSKYTHNPPKSKKKRRRQYVHEHSTRDQATNTDLSSNEGTLEFAPLKKSMSLSDKELPSSAYNLSNSKTAMPTLNTETAILEENTC